MIISNVVISFQLDTYLKDSQLSGAAACEKCGPGTTRSIIKYSYYNNTLLSMTCITSYPKFVFNSYLTFYSEEGSVRCSYSCNYQAPNGDKYDFSKLSV